MEQVRTEKQLLEIGYSQDYPIRKEWNDEEFIDSQVSTSGKTFYKVLTKAEEGME